MKVDDRHQFSQEEGQKQIKEIRKVSPDGNFLIGRNNYGTYLLSKDNNDITQIIPPSGFIIDGYKSLHIDNDGRVIYLGKKGTNNAHYILSTTDDTPIRIPLGMKDPKIVSLNNKILVLEYKSFNEKNKFLQSTIDLNESNFEPLSEVEVLRKEGKEKDMKLAGYEKILERNKLLENWYKEAKKMIKEGELETIEDKNTIAELKTKVSGLEMQLATIKTKIKSADLYKKTGTNMFGQGTFEEFKPTSIK